MGTFHDDRGTSVIVSDSVLLRMRNVLNKIVQQIKTHILFSVRVFSPPKILPFMK
jgi:hypothetical protein